MWSARRALAIAAPLLGACAAMAAPRTTSTTSMTEPPPRVMRDVPIEVSDEPPGEPEPELREVLEPKVRNGPFTRRIDRARVVARGAHALDRAVLRAAASFDNDVWRGAPRRELLAFLREGPVERLAKFTESDARIVAQLQAGSGALADGKLRDETMAVLFAMGFRFSAQRATVWEVRLDFYPGEIEDLDAWQREIDDKVTKRGGGYRDVSPPAGEGSLYVHVGRSIVASYRARGGPPFPILDDAKHVALATKPGVYRLGPAHAHVTSNWYFSQIPWGAEIRRAEDGYQYRWPGRVAWSWATKNPAGTLKMPLDATDFEGLPEVTRDGVTLSIWNKNDFGPIAWNLVPSDMYLHTTPDAENGVRPPGATSLSCSHGCVHVDPRERDEMMSLGYVGANVLFVVRRWDEHVLPDAARRDLATGSGVAHR